MPRKVRLLISDLQRAGFHEIPGGKGSHRKLTHSNYPGVVTISGNLGDDAKPYQERQVRGGYRKGFRMKASDQYLKWVEWSDEDQVYIGKCPDLITGIHGDDPRKVYAELCDLIEEVVAHFASTGRSLPMPRVRPMQEVS